MKTLTISALSIWLLSSCEVGLSHAAQNDEKQMPVKILNSELPKGVIYGVRNAFAGWSLYVMKKETDRYLYYRIEYNHKELFVESVRLAQDFVKFEINSGMGFVLHVRPDCKGLVIEEWKDCAVCESPPIYIEFEQAPIRGSYTIVYDNSTRLPGTTYFQVFKGWRRDGSPVICSVSELDIPQ